MDAAPAKILLLLAMVASAGVGFGAETPPRKVDFRFPGEMSAEIQAKWDGKEKNVVYAIWHHAKLPDTIVDLHFFEDMLVPPNALGGGPRYKNNRRINADLFEWKRLSDGSLQAATSQTLTVDFEMSMKIAAMEGTIEIKGTLKNRESEIDWPGGSALMCYRLRNNPDFLDREGKRVLMKNPDGKIVSVFDQDATATWPFFMHRTFKGYAGPDLMGAFIAKENQTGSLRVEASANPMASISGNRDGLLSCIHANLYLPLNRGEAMPFSATIRLIEKAAAQ